MEVCEVPGIPGHHDGIESTRLRGDEEITVVLVGSPATSAISPEPSGHIPGGVRDGEPVEDVLEALIQLLELTCGPPGGAAPV